jgi:hypothetical protein
MYTTIDYDNLNLKYLYTQCNRTCTRGVYIFNILGAVHISLVWFLPASSPGSSTCVGFATRSSESARRNFPLLPPTDVSPASGTRLDNCSIKFSDTIRPGVARLIWTALINVWRLQPAFLGSHGHGGQIVTGATRNLLSFGHKKRSTTYSVKN